MNPKYKVNQQVKIKDTKTIGKIAFIEFNDDIEQFTYEVITGSKIYYSVFESEIDII